MRDISVCTDVGILITLYLPIFETFEKNFTLATFFLIVYILFKEAYNLIHVYNFIRELYLLLEDMREHYLDPYPHGKPSARKLSRGRMRLTGRAVLKGDNQTNPRLLGFTKQIFYLVEWMIEEQLFLSDLEIIQILRRSPSTDQPTTHEINSLRGIVYRFRKEFGKLIVLYVQIVDMKGFGSQRIYKPIDSLEEYEKISKHLQHVSAAEKARDKSNLAVLNMPSKERKRELAEVSQRLDMQARIAAARKKRGFTKP